MFTWFTLCIERTNNVSTFILVKGHLNMTNLDHKKGEKEKECRANNNNNDNNKDK